MISMIFSLVFPHFLGFSSLLGLKNTNQATKSTLVEIVDKEQSRGNEEVVLCVFTILPKKEKISTRDDDEEDDNADHVSFSTMYPYFYIHNSYTSLLWSMALCMCGVVEASSSFFGAPPSHRFFLRETSKLYFWFRVLWVVEHIMFFFVWIKGFLSFARSTMHARMVQRWWADEACARVISLFLEQTASVRVETSNVCTFSVFI